MESSNQKFPVFRALANGKSFLKIESEKQFVEIQLMGSKIFQYQITANTFPDIQLIQDMINCHENYWTEITKEDYDSKERDYQRSIS